MINNISKVTKDNLCTGCGTCVPMCPKRAIILTINHKKGVYTPQIDEKLCNNCELCLKVCPGHEVNFNSLNLEIFGKKPKNQVLGNYLNCYSGHSTNHNIRYNSSSGGLITQFLIYALNEGIIDGAIVTKMKNNNPLEPEPFIARTKDEIIEASKSKYCPVPVNIALNDILDEKENNKYAIVGLPCHIHGIRKAEIINKSIKEKIILKIGIVCNHTPTFLATEFLLKKIGIENKEIEKLDYRGMGWPGSMKIKKKNAEEEYIPHFSFFYWGVLLNSFFFPRRCTLCCDKICELSDASFADAWIHSYLEKDNYGTSLILSRDKFFEEVLNESNLNNQIKIKKIDEKLLIQSQSLYEIQKRSFAGIKLLNMLKIKTPSYNKNLMEPELYDYINTIIFFIRNSISSYPFWVNFYLFLIKKGSYYKSKLC